MNADASRSRFPWRALSLLAGLVLAGLLAIRAQRPPEPLGPGAPPEVFSAARACSHLDWIAAEPHPIGSPAHARVRERLVATFRSLGLEVQTQRAEVPRRDTATLAWVENVMGRLKGSSGDGAIMLACHYDSVEGSFGAADDGAGVASLLEVLRALKAGPTLERDVIFLVTDGEEDGLLGAKAFVQLHPWAADVRRVVNLEARGTGGPTQMFETSESNLALVRTLASCGARISATSLAGDIYRRMPNATDMTIFRRAGLQGMGFAFIERPWDYHHPTDHVDNLDLGSLQQMGEAALGLARAWGRGSLAETPGQEAVYFNPYGHRFVHYPARWVPWLSLGGVLLLGGLLGWDFRRGAWKFGAYAKALGFLLVLLAAALLAGAGAAWMTDRVHAAWRVQESFSLAYNPWYVLVPLATTLLLSGLLPRWIKDPGVLAALPGAGLTFGCLGAGLLGFLLPGGSYLLQGPLLLALLGALAFPGRLRALLPAALFLALLLPPVGLAAGTALGFGPVLAAGIALLALLALFLVWPLLEALRRSNLLLPTSLLLLATGLVAGGLWARGTFRNRVFANVRYVHNLETGRAWWVAERRHDGPWTRQFLDRPVPGNPSWEGDGRLRPTSEASYLHQEALRFPGPEPRMTLLSDTRSRGLRTLRLAVESGGAEVVWIRGEDPRFLRGLVEGHLLVERMALRGGVAMGLANPGVPGSWRMALSAPPRTPVDVELVFMSTEAPLKIGLQARFGGLPPQLGDRGRPPAGIQPIAEGNCTWIGRVLEVPGISHPEGSPPR